MLILTAPHGKAQQVTESEFPGNAPEAGQSATSPPAVEEGVVDVEPIAAAYEDQYLFEDTELTPFEAGQLRALEPFGREELAVDIVSYRGDDDFFGDEIERGARVHWSHETENWGTFDVDAQFADIESNYAGRLSDGGEAIVTLRQSGVPLSESALFDTTIGHQRSLGTSLLHGGYRFRLPSSILLGVSGEFSGVDSRWRVASGAVGAYRGVRMPRFVDTGGRLTSIGYDRRVTEDLTLGAEVMNVGDDDDIRDHTSLLVGGRYASPDGSQEHAVRLLADDDGNLAFWTDSRHELDFLPTLRYGVFHFDEDVVWADLPIAGGQTGFYARADARHSSRYTFSAGYDYLETVLGAVSATSSDTHSVFLTGSFRLRRALNLGLSANLATRNFSDGVEGNQDAARLNAFATVNSPLGNARIEAYSYELDSDLSSSLRERTGVGLSFNWRMPERVRLTTELRVEDLDDVRGRTRRSEISALFRYDLLENVSLGLNSSLFSTRGAEYAEDDGISLSADARWAFLPNWNLSLSVNHNRADYRVANPGLFPPDGAAGYSSVWLMVSYRQRRGQPYPTFGRTHDGMSGSGSLSGQVFFDLNGDSVRQPSEEVAVGAVVVLDGRYEARTDEQGRYFFAPVPTGAHDVRVLMEQIPLPWGLDDEAPRRVVVRFRQESVTDFPLIVVN